jgi:GH43 family beta-xylosidase
LTYLNPVWPHSFPDPFVLKFRGEYWGYCTGFWPDGRCFGVIRSRDLVHWEPQSGAMAPLPGGHTCYWAPEVTHGDGRFHLYYSVGNEERMEIRVAVAESPAGPFTDSGRKLTTEPFAIDAHVFVDDDGSRHLFYATDFLDRSHVGTGTVRDRMVDPFTLAGEPVPVTLPRHDWHVYHPNRPEKGYVRWHTVEGPFVLKRNGLYYQMFSGGNWQNPTYGVGYAVTDSLDKPGEWAQVEQPILRTIEGRVIGPGHNSVVRGPDNRQLFCVYHRWHEGERVLSIDPMGWEGERLVIDGPSTEPRPGPPPPAFADFFDRPGGLDLAWDIRGTWSTGGGLARQPLPGASGEARLDARRTNFLVEVTARALEDPGEGAGYGIALPGFVFLVPPEVNPRVWHLIRAEVEGSDARIWLDGLPIWQGSLPQPGRSVSLLTDRLAAEFSGFALT